MKKWNEMKGFEQFLVINDFWDELHTGIDISDREAISGFIEKRFEDTEDKELYNIQEMDAIDLREWHISLGKLQSEIVEELSRRSVAHNEEVCDEEEEEHTYVLIRDGKEIDRTSIDEENKELAEELFYDEFGHTRKDGDVVKEVSE